MTVRACARGCLLREDLLENHIQTTRSGNRGCATVRAIAAHFQPRDRDVKLAISLNLSLKAIEQIALELRNLTATQASHVNVVPLRAAFVEMLFTLHVHKIQFIHETMPLK